MKIVLCQCNPVIGDLRGNAAMAGRAVAAAAPHNPDLVVFPELFLQGYPPRDLLEQPWFVEAGNAALDTLRRLSMDFPEIGIVIGEKEYWNQGYGTEAIVTVLRFMFTEMNLHRVMLRVFDFNHRAQRCYEKCGFVLEGRLRQSFYHQGQYCDELVMGLLRDDYLKDHPLS